MESSESPVVNMNTETKEVDPVAALKEAWAKVDGSKSAYLGGVGFLVAVAIVAGILQGVLVGFDTNASPGILGFAIGLVKAVINCVLGTGLVLIALRWIRGEEIRASMVFEPFDKIGPIVLLYFLVSVLVGIGFFLLLIPGIYLSVSYLFAIPLFIDKGLSPWEAMETSRTYITKKWFSYFFTCVLMGIVAFASAIPFGIGLIWTIPMAYNLLAGLYLDAFGDAQ